MTPKNRRLQEFYSTPSDKVRTKRTASVLDYYEEKPARDDQPEVVRDYQRKLGESMLGPEPELSKQERDCPSLSWTGCEEGSPRPGAIPEISGFAPGRDKLKERI